MYEEFCTWWLVSLLFDDLSGHSYRGIKEAKANVHTNQILAHSFIHGTLDSAVS